MLRSMVLTDLKHNANYVKLGSAAWSCIFAGRVFRRDALQGRGRWYIVSRIACYFETAGGEEDLYTILMRKCF